MPRLTVERADEVGTVVWLGDGARENWTLATELCPLAIQVLDVPHAVHWGMLCGKALLGEGYCLLPRWEARIHELLDYRHVLQVRMKRAGQRWGMVRARRMVRLRAVYRTAGAVRFHWAISEGLKAPVATHKNQLLPNAPRRVKLSYTPSKISPRNRAAAASK